MNIKQTAQGTVTLTYEQEVASNAANVAAAFEYLTTYLRENIPGDCTIQQPFGFNGDAGRIAISITIQSPVRPGFPAKINI